MALWNNESDGTVIEAQIFEEERMIVEDWSTKIEGAKLTAYYNWFRNHNGVLVDQTDSLVGQSERRSDRPERSCG